MTDSRSLREEANILRRSPFNRLSFHSVDDRACNRWTIPRHSDWSEGFRAGKAMAAELQAALAEARAQGGRAQSQFGWLVLQLGQRIEDRGVLVGFSHGLDDMMNHGVAWYAVQESRAVAA